MKASRVPTISAAKVLALAFLAAMATWLASPAWAAPCGNGNSNDDAELAACAREDLQDQVDQLRRQYQGLAEALGPRAALGLPDDQARWLHRVSGHCRIAMAGDLEQVAASPLDTAQALCLNQFIQARARDLQARMQVAAESAKAFAAQDYPPVRSTWGDRLNPGGKIPVGRFAAFYLRSGKPAPTLVATDTVAEVAINYPWAEFHDIKSEDFEGYWVGQFRYDKPTRVDVTVDQSWSQTRIVIDRKLVYEGGSNARVPFLFSPGLHTVEVEYINNWHTTRLSVAFAEATEPVAPGELRARLAELAPANAVVQFAAVYESGARDNVVTLNLAPSRVPVVLVLSSYSAVRWVINNPDQVDLRAIVYGSYAPGARVQASGRDGKVKLVPVQGGLGSYDTAPRCHCVGGLFHCEGGSLATTVQTLSSLLGFPVTGFAGEYSPKALLLPAITVTPELMADARATLERLGQERSECRKTTVLQR